MKSTAVFLGDITHPEGGTTQYYGTSRIPWSPDKSIRGKHCMCKPISIFYSRTATVDAKHVWMVISSLPQLSSTYSTNHRTGGGNNYPTPHLFSTTTDFYGRNNIIGFVGATAATVTPRFAEFLTYVPDGPTTIDFTVTSAPRTTVVPEAGTDFLYLMFEFTPID